MALNRRVVYDWECDREGCNAQETTDVDDLPVGWVEIERLDVHGALPVNVSGKHFCGSDHAASWVRDQLS